MQCRVGVFSNSVLALQRLGAYLKHPPITLSAKFEPEILGKNLIKNLIKNLMALDRGTTIRTTAAETLLDATAGSTFLRMSCAWV